jgi:hypothetical protein
MAIVKPEPGISEMSCATVISTGSFTKSTINVDREDHFIVMLTTMKISWTIHRTPVKSQMRWQS